MIHHIVFLKFHPKLSTINIKKVFSALATLKEKIPQIQSFKILNNISQEQLDQGFKQGFEMHFNHPLDLQTYLDHPAHIDVKEKIVRPALQEVLVFDWNNG